jgi:predicted RNase H-like HicB family nuclease
METKEELVTNIKEWIKIDTEIAQLQNEIKARKNKKKQGMCYGLIREVSTSHIK